MTTPSSVSESIQRYGLEAFGRYYGVLRGVVVRNDDPEERGRAQIYVSRNMGDAQIDVWVDPVLVGSGPDRGMFWPAEVGDFVWVFFDNGRANLPIAYMGGWKTLTSGKGKLSSEFSYKTQTGANGQKTVIGPDRRGFITRAGHRLVFDDTVGDEAVSLVWHQPDPTDASRTDRSKSADRSKGKSASLLFKKDGTLELKNSQGAVVVLDSSAGSVSVKDSNGNSIDLQSSGVTISSAKSMVLKGTKLECDFQSISLGKGASAPLLKATEFVQSFLTHVHGTPAGPSTTPIPPVVPPTNATSVVKAK